MKLIRHFCFVCFIFLSLGNLYASENININFNNLSIEDFIKLSSKILHKNILLSSEIKGNVDFIPNTKIKKGDLIRILNYTLEAKGYTLIENNNILRIVKIKDSAHYNLPVISSSSKPNFYQMVTEVFSVPNENVDYVAGKIKHLISKAGKVSTDRSTNSLILTDFPANIKTIKHIITLMSKNSKKDIRVIKLKNINALQTLTTLKKMAASLYNPQVPTQKMSILANKNNNSIIIIGKKENTAYLSSYVKNIDSKASLIRQVVEVIKLKNVEAKNVLGVITAIIGKKKYSNPSSKPFASADEESNTIILMGPQNEIKYLKELIGKLDQDRLQVYVKAKIIEVSENKMKNIGVKYGLLGLFTGAGGLLTISSELNKGAPIAFDPSQYGIDTPTITNGLALGATINLLKENYAANVVSEPSILCINNKESSIYVGSTISIKTGSSTTDGGTINDSYEREDVGLTLKVKPRISNKNKVILSVKTILEDVSQTKTNDQPDTSKKEVETTAIVNNGESIILGGLIKNKDEKTVDGVPFLSDIPWLGNLFKNKYDIKDKINLVIIITPYIIPKSKDLAYVRRELARLRILEDKYTQNMLLNLKKESLKRLKEKAKQDKEMKKIDIETKKFKSKILKEENKDKKTDARKAYLKKTGISD